MTPLNTSTGAVCDTTAQDRIRELVLEAYTEFEEHSEATE